LQFGNTVQSFHLHVAAPSICRAGHAAVRAPPVLPVQPGAAGAPAQQPAAGGPAMPPLLPRTYTKPALRRSRGAHLEHWSLCLAAFLKSLPSSSIAQTIKTLRLTPLAGQPAHGVPRVPHTRRRGGPRVHRRTPGFAPREGGLPCWSWLLACLDCLLLSLSLTHSGWQQLLPTLLHERLEEKQLTGACALLRVSGHDGFWPQVRFVLSCAGHRWRR
jgi:hypothetical protein